MDKGKSGINTKIMMELAVNRDDARKHRKRAVKALHTISLEIDKKERSDGELRLVLAEVVVIVLGWKRSKDERAIASIVKDLRRKIEHKQGRPGCIETLLLRVAYEHLGVDKRKLSAWGTACRNLVTRLDEDDDLEEEMTSEAERRSCVQRCLLEFGIERARKAEFDS